MKRHGKRWTQQEKNFLKKHYSNKSEEFLVDKLQRTWGAIRGKAISELGLTRSFERKVWTEEELELVKENYESGDKELFKKLLPHRSWNQIMIKASEMDLKQKPCEIEFFRNWSNDLAYFLGLWLSNGCLSTHGDTNSRYVMITVPSEKVSILESIKQKIKFKNKIITHGDTSYRLIITNTEVYNLLREKGAKEDKYRNIDIPKVPEKYLSHFVRGYTDGNGFIKSNYSDFIALYYHSWLSILRSLKTLIAEQVGVYARERIIHRNKVTKEIIFKNKQAEKVLDWLYDDTDESDLFWSNNYETYMNYKSNAHYPLTA